MAEPLPTPRPESIQPQKITIGDTPVYFRVPQPSGGRRVESVVILDPKRRATAGQGPENAVLLTRERNWKNRKAKEFIDKPISYNDPYEEVDWNLVSGLRWTDEQGVVHTVPKDALSLTPPEKQTIENREQTTESSVPSEVPAVPQTETQQPPTEAMPAAPLPAREVLQTVQEDPTTITIVGLKAYETRARDLADRSMQKLVLPAARDRSEAAVSLWQARKEDLRGIGHYIKDIVWKKSIAGIYFQERARQYYLDMLTAAETPFAEDAIRLAEARAKLRFDAAVADKNILARIGQKAAESWRDATGARTMVQRMALTEIATMKTAGELKGAKIFEREAAAVRQRFGMDFDTAANTVRTKLGEKKLELLDPANAANAQVVEGIKSLLKRYALEDIPDKAALDNEAKTFFQTTLKDARPDMVAEAELYSSSLFDAAESLRARRSHEGGSANIEEALAGLQVRLGMGMMGEVTSMDATAVEKGIAKVRDIYEWLNKQHVAVPFFFNETTVGAGVAIALSGLTFLRNAPLRVGMVAAQANPMTALGGGALAGGLFAGWREYGAIQKDYMTHLREREAGDTFTDTKRRNWFEQYAVRQRSAEEMTRTITDALYDPDTHARKATLTDDELRTTMATLADYQARRALSEAGAKRIGLIRFSDRGHIETERTALDAVAAKALADVQVYVTDHPELTLPPTPAEPISAEPPEAGTEPLTPNPSSLNTLFGPLSFEDYMVKLTQAQTLVLKQGVQTLDYADDTIRGTLDIITPYAPEADILRRRFTSLSSTVPVHAEGMDAILAEFNRAARVEAVKYGAKAGVIGAGIGAAIHGIADIWHNAPAIDQVAEAKSKTLIDRLQELRRGDQPIEVHADPNGDETFTLITNGEGSDKHQVFIGKDPYAAPKDLQIHQVNDKYSAVITPEDGKVRIVLGDDMSGDELTATLRRWGMEPVPPHVPGQHDWHVYATDGHLLETSLPEGFRMVPGSGDHTYNFIRESDGMELAHGLQFKPDGTLINSHGLQMQLDANTRPGVFDVDHQALAPRSLQPEAPVVPTSYETGPEPLRFTNDLPIGKDELQGKGIWDYFQEKIRETDTPNISTATNGQKNLFRLYEHYYADANGDGIPENVRTAGELATRPATYGDTPVAELDPARLPPDTRIDLPSSVFGDEKTAWFAQKTDAAVEHFNALLKEGKTNGEALEILESGSDEDKIQATLLRLGYFDDAHLPDKAELDTLLETMNPAGPQSRDVLTAAKPSLDSGTEQTQQLVIKNMLNTQEVPGYFRTSADTVAIPYSLPAETVVPQPEAVFTPSGLPWFPVIIPVREPLERLASEVPIVLTRTAVPDLFTAPYAGESRYLTKEDIQKRVSPRLAEDYDARLDPKQEIGWYLDNLSPEDKQVLESLAPVLSAVPLAADTRAVVAIPVGDTEPGLYDRLKRYAIQTDAAGNPMAPTTTELVVYRAAAPSPTAPGSPAPDADLERFRAEHPDIPLVVLSHTYDAVPTQARVKRDLTNALLTRIHARPDATADVVIINDPGANTSVPATYLASVLDAFDANPAEEMAAGAYKFPPETYGQYPNHLAANTVHEYMDALVRHGEMGGMPDVVSGNTAVKASALAAVGGYNPEAAAAEDRELAWVIQTARHGHPDAIKAVAGMTATPGLPEFSGSPGAPELEVQVNTLYSALYPGLKAGHPDRFDAYFTRAMQASGITYELRDGTVHITGTDKLPSVMAANIDVDAYAADAIRELANSSPITPISPTGEAPQPSPRETLASVAGVESAHAVETIPGVGEAPADQTPGVGLSPAESSPNTPISPTNPAESSLPPSPEPLPEGVENRIETVLNKTSNSQETVTFTPNELMDYLKSTMDIAGYRIKSGTASAEGNVLHMKDVTVKTQFGDAVVNADYVTIPDKGITVDRKTLSLKLPLLARLTAGKTTGSVANLPQEIVNRLNSVIDQNWQAKRIDIANEKIDVQFTRKNVS